MRLRRDRIELKTAGQMERMRAAGLVVADTLARVADAAQPGISTGELDAIAAQSIRKAGATPSFLGYHGFPATICVSINDEIVHGIPGERVVADGDLVSIDCGAVVDGWHGDAAVTVCVGTVTPEHRRLAEVTESALWRGLAQALVGGRLSDIGHAVESEVTAAGEYGIVEEYVGHGIGSRMHMDPGVPNHGLPGHGPVLRPGMALAVEPMITAGRRHTRTLADDWTVVTQDGSWAAHAEHTVAITADGPWVLTAHDGGAARFAQLGVPSPAASRP